MITLNLHGKVYAWTLERRVCLLVETRILKEGCGFLPDCGKVDWLLIFLKILKDVLKFTNQSCGVEGDIFTFSLGTLFWMEKTENIFKKYITILSTTPRFSQLLLEHSLKKW